MKNLEKRGVLKYSLCCHSIENNQVNWDKQKCYTQKIIGGRDVWMNQQQFHLKTSHYQILVWNSIPYYCIPDIALTLKYFIIFFLYNFVKMVWNKIHIVSNTLFIYYFPMMLFIPHEQQCICLKYIEQLLCKVVLLFFRIFATHLLPF